MEKIDQIKFKALTAPNGEEDFQAVWKYGYFHKAYTGECYIIEFSKTGIVLPGCLVQEASVCRFSGFQDINKEDLYEGDIVTFRDFRGLHTTASSKYDGFSEGWVGVIRYSNHDGWYIDKQNEINNFLLEPKENEKEQRTNPYFYRQDSMVKYTNPMKIGNFLDDPLLLTLERYLSSKTVLGL